MIAAVEWIPAGRANPTPSKYEYSRAEREFVARVQAAAASGGGLGGNEEDDEADVVDATAKNNGAKRDGSDEEWEDVDEDDDEADEGKEATTANGLSLPKVDPSSLPADLRMDEYSDDDDDDGDEKERVIGGLLLSKDAEMMIGGDEAAPEREEDDGDAGDDNDDDDDDDSEDEDDLADIPDTREYMPLDLEGLQSLGIGGSSSGGNKLPQGYTAEDLRNMTLNDDELLHDYDEEEEDEDDEDADDVEIREGDALVVVARTEEDFASLEVNVFDVESSNLYVHHDIPLPSFPLCLALGSVVASYGDHDGGGATSGNYVAVGSFEPGIEIWNLDVMNALEPTMVLGGMDTRGAEEDWMSMQMPTSSTIGSGNGGGGGSKKKKKKKKGGASSAGGRPGLREGSHTDAVMSLSWNAVHAQVLASGSADGTVKLWDVTQAAADYVRPSATLTHHTDKVGSMAWHPSEGTLLATGGYDRRVCLVDARSAASGRNDSSVKKAKLSADCEALAWDPHNQQYLTAASEDGVVRCWDVRKFGLDCDPVWSVVAHEYGGVSDVCYNARVPGMLVTCSIDKTVALWDTREVIEGAPRSCGSKDMNVGKLYSVSCYPSRPWLMACGGSGNELAVWDMEGEEAICKRFADRVGGAAAAAGQDNEREEPDFEAIMAAGDDKAAAEKALENMTKSKNKKKNKGGNNKKKNKAHKRK